MSHHIDDVRLTLNCFVTYYKPSGKMYAEEPWHPKVRCSNLSGRLVADWSDAMETLKNHLRAGQRPGLCDCPIEDNDFMIILRPHDGADHGYPVVICNPMVTERDKWKKLYDDRFIASAERVLNAPPTFRLVVEKVFAYDADKFDMLALGPCGGKRVDMVEAASVLTGMVDLTYEFTTEKYRAKFKRAVHENYPSVFTKGAE